MYSNAQKLINIFSTLAFILIVPPVNGQPYAKQFEVSIEQHGETKQPNNHVYELDKAPFTIVIRMSAPLGVLINASFKPTSFELAKNQVDINNIPGFKGTGMAEYRQNLNKEIVIEDTAPSYWYYTDAKDHRFDEILVQPNGEVICKRHIKNLRHAETETNIPVEQVENDLYLVLTGTEWRDDYTKQYEIMKRAYLKITFEGNKVNETPNPSTTAYDRLHQYTILEKHQIGANTLAILEYVDNESHTPFIGFAWIDKYHLIKAWLTGAKIHVSHEGSIAENNYTGMPACNLNPQKQAAGKYFHSIQFEDLNHDDILEIIVDVAFEARVRAHTVFIYQQQSGQLTLLLKLSGFGYHFKLKDLNHDGFKEVLHTYSLVGGGAPELAYSRWTDVWEWKDNQYIKRNHYFPQVYESLMQHYTSEAVTRNSLVNCLLQQAKKNKQGIFAGACMCEKLYQS